MTSAAVSFLSNVDTFVFYHQAGHSPLHIACAHGNKAVVEMLLEKGGVPVNIASDMDGCTPMHVACGAEHEDIVNVLLDAKANPNLRSLVRTAVV